MIGVLKQLEAGRKAEDVAREVGVSKHTQICHQLPQLRVKDLKDSQLADEAQFGLRGQGAIVEMMRRLRLSNEFLSKVGIAVAIVGIILAVVQIWLFVSQ